VRPACAEAFAETIANAARATGRMRSRIIQRIPGRRVTETLRRVAQIIVLELTKTGLIRCAPPAPLTNDLCRRHPA
jgi:hypothetical protein